MDRAPAKQGPATPAEYLASFSPRVPGLAYTAPAYDEVTKPQQAPYPAACVTSATRCQCYTQQATKLQMDEQLCRSIAEGGFFVAWQDPARDRNTAPQPAQAQVVREIAGTGILGTSLRGWRDPTPSKNDD